jgi:type II secretory pathway pseudopilin PulG
MPLRFSLHRRRRLGVTLVETLIAAVVILIIFAFLSESLVSSLKLSKRTSNRLESNAYAAAAAVILSHQGFAGAEGGFIAAGPNGVRLLPAAPSAARPAEALDGLRYAAATSPVQGTNLIRVVVVIHDERGLQTQAVAAYAAN